MATAAFKSTTKRNSIGGVDDTTSSSSSGARRRTRSVSRLSHCLPPELIDCERQTPLPSTRRKFVNTVRGAGFPEISLDDLAIQLFSSGERGRSSEIYSSESAAAPRRGRSVSRQSSLGKSVIGGRSSGGSGLIGADRRRRSLSAVRYRASDTESNRSEKYTCNGNVENSDIGNKQKATLHMQVSPNQDRKLQRCSSQTDFLKLHDSCSSRSYSSTLTDDEACDACYGSDGYENLQSINASKKLDQYEVVQKKHRNAGEEIRTGLQQNQRNNDDSQRISRRLKEDAEKIIEDFISSVEDSTDISSFDGERSDTSSAFGVSMRPRNSLMHCGEAKSYSTPLRTESLSEEMDGVVFPWLLWETSNDDTPQFRHQKQIPTFSKTCLQDPHEGINTREEQKQSTRRVIEIHKSQLLKNVPRRSRVVDLDDYMAPQSDENCLVERWKLRSIINSGGILMCEGSRGPILL